MRSASVVGRALPRHSRCCEGCGFDGRKAAIRGVASLLRGAVGTSYWDLCTMTRTPPSRKQASHERILAAAVRAIQCSGFDGTGIAAIMKEAGLTHGGFYAHFDSREAMLAAAADRAGAESVAVLEQRAASAPPGQAFRTLVRTYLSREHVGRTETDCCVAAVGSELPRQAPDVRRAATRRIKEMTELVGRHSPQSGEPGAHERALVVTSTMVGALLLARAVDDPRFSDSMLAAARQNLIGD